MTERDSRWLKLNAERNAAKIEQDIADDSSALRRVVADPAIALAKGVISVPEAAVGLADIVSKGRAGKAMEDAGFKFREAKDTLSSYQTGEQQMAQGRVAQAKGFIPTVQALVENPTVAAESIIESLPLMFGGGALSQAALAGIKKLGPKFAAWAAGASAPVIAGAVGEGVVGAGSAAENIRQQSPDRLLTWEQAGYAAASGAGTSAFGILGGKAAQKLGLEDFQTAMARGGASSAQKVTLPKFKAIIAGALQEGALEELPQSAQEQMFSNLALGKPWDEGLAEAAAQGFVAGAAMGGGVQAMRRGQPAAGPTPPPIPPQPAPATPTPAPTAATTPPAAPRPTPAPVVPPVAPIQQAAPPTPAPRPPVAPAQRPAPVAAPAQPAPAAPAPTAFPPIMATRSGVGNVAADQSVALNPTEPLPQEKARMVSAGAKILAKQGFDPETAAEFSEHFVRSLRGEPASMEVFRTDLVNSATQSGLVNPNTARVKNVSVDGLVGSGVPRERAEQVAKENALFNEARARQVTLSNREILKRIPRIYPAKRVEVAPAATPAAVEPKTGTPKPRRVAITPEAQAAAPKRQQVIPETPSLPEPLEGQPYDTRLETRPEASMPAIPVAELGIERGRVSPVDPDLAAAVEDIRGGYAERTARELEREATPETQPKSNRLPIEEFHISYWLNGDKFDGVPDRADKYRPGQISWGKDVDRGLSIQASRGARQYAANAKQFNEEILPVIAARLTPKQLFEIAEATKSAEALKLSGYRLWRKDDKQQWMASGDPREKEAESIGASVVAGAMVGDKAIKKLPAEIVQKLLSGGYEVVPAGESNAGFRQLLMENLVGKVPKSKAGVTAVKDALIKYLGVNPSNTLAGIDDEIRSKLKSMLPQPPYAPQEQAPVEVLRDQPPGTPAPVAEGKSGEVSQAAGEGAKEARDKSKPEQMTPEEFSPKADPINQGIFKSKKEASERLLQMVATIRSSKQMSGILSQYGLKPEDAYEIAKTEGGKWSLGATHKHRVATAFLEKKPVSTSAVDTYGIKLPPGYIREGELYVYRPEGKPEQARVAAPKSDFQAVAKALKSAYPFTGVKTGSEERAFLAKAKRLLKPLGVPADVFDRAVESQRRPGNVVSWASDSSVMRGLLKQGWIQEPSAIDPGEQEVLDEIAKLKSVTGPLNSSERIDLNELRLSAQNKKLSRLSQAYLENLEERAGGSGEQYSLGGNVAYSLGAPAPRVKPYGDHDWTAQSHPPGKIPTRLNGFLGVVTDGSVSGKWYVDVTQPDHTEIGYRPHSARFRFYPQTGVVAWITEPSSDDRQAFENWADKNKLVVSRQRGMDYFPSAFSLGSTPTARPAPSLSKMQVEQAVRELFDGNTPPNFQVTHNYGKTFNNREVRGWYDPATGTIWLNAAYLRSPQEARAVFIEEAFHAIQNDKAVQGELSRLVASLTPEQLSSAKAAYGNISEEQLRMEAVADILEQQQLTQEQRGMLARLWDAVLGAVQRLYGKFTGKVFTERDAQDVLAKALKAAAVGRRSLKNGGEVYAEGGLAAKAKAFFSRLFRTVEQSQQNKASGAQWKATIKNSKLGANLDEMALVGVNDLEDGKVYSRQEVLDYLQANQVEVKDVTLGGKPAMEWERVTDQGEPYYRAVVGNSEYQVIREALEYPLNGHSTIWRLFRLDDVPHSRRDETRSLFSDTDAGKVKEWAEQNATKSQLVGLRTHFSTYQLPGAKEGSYREVFLTVPGQTTKPKFKVIRFGDAVKIVNERDGSTAWYGENVSEADSQLLKEKYEQAIQPSPLTWADGHAQYQGVKNPIVRLRFNERTTPDGKRMLFLEEVQAPQKGEFEKMPALFQKNWREIAFKWALRHAAENGFEAVGWTTGQQQVERYRDAIIKEVSSVEWSGISLAEVRDGKLVTAPTGEKSVTLILKNSPSVDIVVNGRGEVVRSRNDKNGAPFVGKGLDEIIGKPMAEKILSEPKGKLEEAGIEVGGEGLKKLYDVDFRNVVGKLPAVRNAGGKVGMTSVSADKKGWHLTPPSQTTHGGWMVKSSDYNSQGTRFSPSEQGEAEARAFLAERLKGSEVSIHALPITPAIADSVMGGQAMFSTGSPQNQLDQKYFEAIQRGDMQEAQALVDEAARGAGYDLGPLYHGTTDEKPFNEFKKSDTDSGIHFGSRAQAEARIAEKVGKRFIAAYLKSANMLEVRDVFGTPSPETTLANELRKKGVLNGVELADFTGRSRTAMAAPLDMSKVEVIEDSIRSYQGYESMLDYAIADGSGRVETASEGLGYGNLKDITSKADAVRAMVQNRLAEKINRSPLLRELEAKIKEAGYDLLAYRNAIEGTGGENDYSFAALDSNQIKSADPITRDDSGNIIPLSQRFQQESPDIRYSLGAPVSQSDATEVQGRAIEPSIVAAASRAVADLGRQQVEEFKQAGRELEGLAYESKSFRNARSELNSLVSLHEGRLRQLPQDRVTDDMRANIRDGVSIENGQIVVGDDLVTKLAQMGVQFRPELVKALQAEVHFEQQARRLVDNLGKLATLKELKDYYTNIKAPADEILKLDKLIAAKEKVVANLTPVTTNRGRGQQSIGERASEITRANASKVELQAKRDALTLEPVQEFFGKGITELRDLSEKAKAAADLTRALMDSSTSISEVARLGEIYDKWASFDRTVKDALKKGTLTDEQRTSVLTSLQRSFDEFDVAKSQMDDLLNSEEKGLLKDIRLAEADIADAKVTSGLADVLVADALKAAKGEMGLTGTVGDAANIANLEASTGAITTLAANLGRTIDQNRWLYDFLMAPGDMPAFGASVAQSLGISETALREVLKVVQQSPSLASAIVTLTDDAAAKLANSPPNQMQSIATLATTGNPVAMALAANLTSQIVQQANAQGTKANAARQAAARQLAQSVLRLRTLQQGQALFSKTANSPAFQQLRSAVATGASEAQKMVVLGPTGPVLRGFKSAAKEYQPELKIDVDTSALELSKTRDKVWKYLQNAEQYIADYEAAAALYAANPANPSPSQLGFDVADYNGLKFAIENQIAPMFLNMGDMDDTARAAQYLTPVGVRKFMKLPAFLGQIFNQYEQLGKMVGGFAGNTFRQQIAKYKRGYLNAKGVASQFQDLPKLQSAAMQSHNIRSEDTYRRIFNEMAHYGRLFGTPLRVGFTLPVSNQVVTKADMEFLKRTLAFEEKLRREVTEIDPVTGVRYMRGGKEITRKGAYTGDLGMPRHMNRGATQFIADVTNAYAGTPKGFTPTIDLSASSQDEAVKYWNEHLGTLKQHILDSLRTDRSFKQSAEMAAAEKRIASRWLAGNMDQVNSVQDLVDLIAAEIPTTSGKNPLDTAREGLNNELLQYVAHAERIQKERAEDNAKTSGLSIALSSENEYTKPAAYLELPSEYYDYGAVSSIDRITAQARANHSSLIDFANSIRLAITELRNRLDRLKKATTDKERALILENYKGNQQEMEDVLELLTTSLKNFEDSYRAGGPDLVPTRLGQKILKATVGSVLAKVEIAIRNLSQGQLQVFTNLRAMNYMSARLAAWKALSNVPRGMINTSYMVARNIAGFADRRLGRDPQFQRTLKGAVDVVADGIFKTAQAALFKPMVGAENVRKSFERVFNLGFDTSGDSWDTIKQAWIDSGQFRNQIEQDEAMKTRTSRAINLLDRLANTALDSVNAVVRGSVLESSDTGMNALSLGLVGNMEQRLEEVAMVFGKRLTDLGITRIDPTDKRAVLQANEWLPSLNQQTAANSLGEIRKFLESSASSEGFSLEQNLLQYYQDKMAGKPAEIFNQRTFDAVQRSMIAENNAALPTNRASAGQASTLWRTLLTLQGYPADAFLKMMRIATGGTRDRKAVLQAASKISLALGVAALAIIVQGSGDAGAELWKRKMQGKRADRPTPLDADFYTDPDHLKRAMGNYLLLSSYYVGDIIRGAYGWVDGRSTIDPLQKAFALATASQIARDISSGVKIAMKGGATAEVLEPLRKSITRLTFGAPEIEQLLGKERDNTEAARRGITENAKAKGFDLPAPGFGGTVGLTNVKRKALSQAVSDMDIAKRKGDTEGYNKAKAAAQKQIAELEAYYLKQRLEAGDSPEVAAKTAKASVWGDYQENNPVTAALGGKRPTAEQYKQLVESSTGERGEVIRQGIKAWQDGAQALFGRAGNITKEDVAENRSGGTVREPSYGRVSLTGGVSGRMRSVGTVARGRRRAKIRRVSLTGRRRKISPMRSRRKKIRRVRLTA